MLTHKNAVHVYGSIQILHACLVNSTLIIIIIVRQLLYVSRFDVIIVKVIGITNFHFFKLFEVNYYNGEFRFLHF